MAPTRPARVPRDARCFPHGTCVIAGRRGGRPPHERWRTAARFTGGRQAVEKGSPAGSADPLVVLTPLESAAPVVDLFSRLLLNHAGERSKPLRVLTTRRGIGRSLIVARKELPMPDEKGPVATFDSTQWHEVKAGDTLSKIAVKYYGDASLYTKIFEANKDVLKDPNMIRVGQKLRIP
jgi:nucleoid-associated protein YgaU